MAKQVTVDRAVELLHDEKLECRLEWVPDMQRCNIRVYDAGTFMGGFGIHDGCIDKNEMQDLIEDVHQERGPTRPPLALVANPAPAA
jgi:hypothetical protein